MAGYVNCNDVDSDWHWIYSVLEISTAQITDTGNSLAMSAS
jgi:hypothetical protein